MAQAGDIVKINRWAETGILIPIGGGNLVAVPHAVEWEEFGRPEPDAIGSDTVAQNTVNPRPAEIVPDTVITDPQMIGSGQEDTKPPFVSGTGSFGDEATTSPRWRYS